MLLKSIRAAATVLVLGTVTIAMSGMALTVYDTWHWLKPPEAAPHVPPPAGLVSGRSKPTVTLSPAFKFAMISLNRARAAA